MNYVMCRSDVVYVLIYGVYISVFVTLQHWVMTLKKHKSQDEVMCIVERPDLDSYIMFESFSLQLSNAKIHNIRMFVSIATPALCSLSHYTELSSLLALSNLSLWRCFVTHLEFSSSLLSMLNYARL